MSRDLYKALASAVYVSGMTANGRAITTDDQRIRASGLYDDWTERAWAVGEACNAGSQTWECYMPLDPALSPGVTPETPSWRNFFRPLHGKAPETARPFVPVQGSYDMYRAGEYMIWTDGQIHKCLQDTNFSPEEYPAAWEVTA